MEKLDQLFEVINEIKHLEREGWQKRDIEKPLDTVASHTLGATINGWILAEKEGLDSEKVVKMLLIHDLIMAHIPDYTPEDEEYASKKQFEEEKLEELYQKAPSEIRPEFKSLIEELRERETAEAQIAKEADKLDTLMQASKYNQETEENMLEEFLETYEDYFKTTSGKAQYDKIREKSDY